MRYLALSAAMLLAPGMASAGASFELDRLYKDDIGSVEPAPARPSPVPANEKIVGGGNADKGEFPFMAALVIGMDFCGGSLIKEDWVLTAAHCIQEGRIIAVIGATGPDLSGSEKFVVDEVVLHPSWDPSTLDHDFALLHLPESSKYPPIPLNKKELDGDPLLTAAGWGRTATDGGMSQQLKKARLSLVPRERCAAQILADENAVLTDSMLCAKGAEEGDGTCYGDSGGPLILGSGAEMTLAGVTSWGPKGGCARPGKANGFGKVDAVLDWIEATTLR